MQIEVFTFNFFQENTYLLYDETHECVIIDPGCYNTDEKNHLKGFISKKNLKPVRLLQTHCHIDHILGSAFVSETYQLGLEMHKEDLPVLNAAGLSGDMYGIRIDTPPQPSKLIKEGETIIFGKTELSVLFTPGHSPGSICFYNEKDKIIIAGDVLFKQSIGRTDLPGGDYDTLINSIKDKLFSLGEDITVYPGHGPSTTIAEEKKYNPFVGEKAISE